jgi:pimeloyl-ACP methyl ester carboxylesterase
MTKNKFNLYDRLMHKEMGSMNTSELSGAGTPVLILIHGATWNGRVWDVVRPQLDTAYRVLTPDLPGHGARRDEKYTLEGAVATIVAAAQSVAPASVVLAGDSLGGYTAMAAAAALPPEQLRGLVLAGCSANMAGRTLMKLQMRSALFTTMVALFGEQRIVRKSMGQSLAKLGLDAADFAASIDAGISLRAFPQAVAALSHVDFLGKLRAINQPVVLVNGSLDTDMVRQEAAFVTAAQQGSVVRFDDCPHWVSIVRHSEFAMLLNQFVARVTTIPAAQEAAAR